MPHDTRTGTARRLPLPALILALGTSLTLLSGCSATVLDGTAQRDPGVGTDAVIPALLNPGNYPTKPTPLGNAGNLGGQAESRRMAENVVLPFEVDPMLVKSGGLQTGVINDEKTVNVGVDATAATGAVGHNYLAGFTVLADNEGQQNLSLKNTVLRFASPEDAKAAFEDMVGRTGMATNAFDKSQLPTQPASVPRYADSRAVTWKTSPDSPAHLLGAFTLHGGYVLYQETISTTSAEVAAELAAKTLDLQIPKIDSFAATPADKLADLPLDPDGLVARTLPAPEDLAQSSNGAYGPHGMLAFSGSPAVDQKTFKEVGLKSAARAGATTYAAADAAGATKIVDTFAATVESQGLVQADGVPALPSVQCLQTEPTKYSNATATYCVGSADNVAFEVSGGNAEAVHQMAAAQYLLLTSN